MDQARKEEKQASIESSETGKQTLIDMLKISSNIGFNSKGEQSKNKQQQSNSKESDQQNSAQQRKKEQKSLFLSRGENKDEDKQAFQQKDEAPQQVNEQKQTEKDSQSSEFITTRRGKRIPLIKPQQIHKEKQKALKQKKSLKAAAKKIQTSNQKKSNSSKQKITFEQEEPKRKTKKQKKPKSTKKQKKQCQASIQIKQDQLLKPMIEEKISMKQCNFSIQIKQDQSLKPLIEKKFKSAKKREKLKSAKKRFSQPKKSKSLMKQSNFTIQIKQDQSLKPMIEEKLKIRKKRASSIFQKLLNSRIQKKEQAPDEKHQEIAQRVSSQEDCYIIEKGSPLRLGRIMKDRENESNIQTLGSTNVANLGSLSLLELVQILKDLQLITQQDFENFASNHTFYEAKDFLEKYNSRTLNQFDFKLNPFTLLDHRRLAQVIAALKPKDYFIGDIVSINQEFQNFLVDLYNLLPEDYRKLCKEVDEISKILWWDILMDQNKDKIMETINKRLSNIKLQAIARKQKKSASESSKQRKSSLKKRNT